MEVRYGLRLVGKGITHLLDFTGFDSKGQEIVCLSPSLNRLPFQHPKEM